MKLIHKLILGFLIVALLIWVNGYLAVTNSKRLVKNYFINSSRSLAIELMKEIDSSVFRKIELFQEYSSDELLGDTLMKSNQDFDKLDDIMAYITEKDYEWTSAAKEEITPFMQNLINNKLSDELREKAEFYEIKYGYKTFGEIFVTNKYGANIAQTGKTTDYRQDDEEWWQSAKRDGLYIRDVDYDESSDMYSIDIGIGVEDYSGNFIGVLKFTLNIEEVANIMKELKLDDIHKRHNTMRFKLITKDGKLIYSSDKTNKFLEDVSSFLPEPGHLLPEHGHHYEDGSIITIKNDLHKELFVVQAHSDGFRDYKGLGWILILEHEADELFAPLTQLINRTLAVSLAVTILAVLLGILISSYITKSIKKLRDAAISIGKGDLDTRIEVNSSDEIGQLAKEFKHMTENLKTTTVRLDEYAREVEEHKRTEDLLLQSQQDWIDTFDTITDIITIQDNNYNIVRANKAAEKILKLPDSAINKAVKCFKHYHGTDTPPEGCQSCDSLNTGLPATFEIFEPHLNIFVEIKSIPRVDKNNKVKGLIHVARDITKRKHDEGLIQKQLNRLNTLRSIDKAIIGNTDLRIILDIFLEQVKAQLNIDAVSVLLLNKHTQILEYVAGKGFRSNTLKYTKLRLGESNAGRAAIERRTVTIPNLKKDINGFVRSKQFTNENFVSYFAVPLVAKGHVKGVLELFHRSPLGADPDWMEFLEAIVDQGAIAIDNANLLDELQQSNLELTLAYDTTIEGWSHAMDLRDKETEGHSQRVAEMTLRIARELGIKDENIVHIRRGALLHDLGKIGVPDSVLLKPGPLSEDEWAIMRRHPEYAYNMLYPIEHLRPAIDIPYYHHEKWDGTGYPKELKGEEIPLAARIFAIVDVWDALTSDRPYRPAWPKEKAIEHIRSLTGVHFDPKVAEVFFQCADG